MANLAVDTFNAIKSRLYIIWKGGDPDRFRLTFPFPEPEEDCHPYARQQWETLKRNHKWPHTFTERLEKANEAFQLARETDSVGVALQQLKALRLYLEAEAAKPAIISSWIDRNDGTQGLFNAARPTHLDEFFEERVLTILREVIPQLEDLVALMPPNGPAPSAKNDVPQPETAFEDAILDRNNAREIVEALRLLYVNRPKKDYVYMVRALYELTLIANPYVDQTVLQKRLSASFGEVGSRANLNATLTNLNAASAKESLEIQVHKENIINAVSHLKLQSSC